MQLEGTDLPVWAMEIDPDKAKQQFRSYSASDKGTKVGKLCLYDKQGISSNMYPPLTASVL